MLSLGGVRHLEEGTNILTADRSRPVDPERLVDETGQCFAMRRGCSPGSQAERGTDVLKAVKDAPEAGSPLEAMAKPSSDSLFLCLPRAGSGHASG